MENRLQNISTKKPYFGYVAISITILIITLIVPKQGRFKYEYEIGKPWAYDDLLSPFSYPISKTEDEVKKEKAEMKKKEIFFCQNNLRRSQNTQAEKSIFEKYRHLYHPT